MRDKRIEGTLADEERGFINKKKATIMKEELLKIGKSIKFSPGNKIVYGQDFSSRVGVPTDITFTVERLYDDIVRLTAYGYGIISKSDRKSYGNGAIYINRRTLEEQIMNTDVVEKTKWLVIEECRAYVYLLLRSAKSKKDYTLCGDCLSWHKIVDGYGGYFFIDRDDKGVDIEVANYPETMGIRKRIISILKKNNFKLDESDKFILQANKYNYSLFLTPDKFPLEAVDAQVFRDECTYCNFLIPEEDTNAVLDEGSGVTMSMHSHCLLDCLNEEDSPEVRPEHVLSYSTRFPTESIKRRTSSETVDVAPVEDPATKNKKDFKTFEQLIIVNDKILIAAARSTGGSIETFTAMVDSQYEHNGKGNITVMTLNIRQPSCSSVVIYNGIDELIEKVTWSEWIYDGILDRELKVKVWRTTLKKEIDAVAKSLLENKHTASGTTYYPPWMTYEEAEELR